MSKSKENKKVLLVFVASYVVLISVGIFSYYTLDTLKSGEKSVDHIRNILQATNNTLLGMVKIEEKYNKFVFSGEKSDENNFRAIVFIANQDIKVLINLTYDDGVQNNRALSLEYLLSQRAKFAEMAFDLRHYNGHGVKSVDYRDKIHLIADQFEAIAQQMQGEEERLLLLRNADVAQLLSQSKTVLVLGTFLGLLLTATAFWNVLRDSSGRRLAERALFAEHEHAQVTLNSIGDAVVSTDPQGNVTFLNFVAEKMTGWSRHGAAGRPMDEVYRIREARNRTVAPSWTEMAMQQDATITLPSDCILFRRDGSTISIEGCVSPIHDSEGQASGAVIVFHDVSAAQAMTLQIAHNAEHDFLTGLPNRVLLGDRIDVAIASARRHSNTFALLFLDLDNFKYINDSLGHPLGDKLLQSIAKRLEKCVRGTDTVSRQGGDEFVVILTELGQPEDAALIARKMLQVVAQANFIDRHDLHVTTSIGISIYPDDGHDAETLIKNADTAMYQAKENGRQSYEFFRPEMNVRAVERQSIEEGLRRALERREFVLHYQPIIDLTTGAITGAEALIRWNHPTRGLVRPLQFIPVAEDCGLIVPISAWVLREACQQARAWEDAGLPPMTMAVNVSANEFRDENFLAGLFGILGETGLDPKLLVLELTESLLMKHADVAVSILHSLREKGVQVAIDDFGTGYSSLGYLRKFPLDALKIDQSFVRQISNAEEDTTIVTAVIALAQSLNLRVIAEGVEVLEELHFLQAHHCDEVQGYYFSHPVMPDEFARLQTTGIPEPEDAAWRFASSEAEKGKAVLTF